jgi:hypothetical protein
MVPKELQAAFDVFAKATSLPDGPSLSMQRHDPTWEAWKKLCDEFAKANKS